MKVHVLKTRAPWFDDVRRDEKTFEVRVDDGRGFAVGDVLVLREWIEGCCEHRTSNAVAVFPVCPNCGTHVDRLGYTGRAVIRRVRYRLELDALLEELTKTELEDPVVVLGLAYATDDQIAGAAAELGRVIAAEIIARDTPVKF